MNPSGFKKFLSLFMAFIMIFAMVPVTGLYSAVETVYPVMKAYNTVAAMNKEDYHAYKSSVVTVTFLDKIDEAAISAAAYSFDVSADKDGSVMAWMVENAEETNLAGATRYDVYIAGDGGVGANPNSSNVFFNFTNLKQINGFENFKTGNVTDFSYFFELCKSLKSVDLSFFDTSEVTNLSYFFVNCTSLESADLSNWNTSKVTTMRSMFENCNSLTDVKLRSFDTSNVTTMENTFKNCYELTTLDLSSFDTSKVTTMRFMFYLCKKLTTIYAGDGWTTEAISNLNDGVFNCCYAKFGVTEDEYAQELQNGRQFDASIDKATFEEGGYLTYKQLAQYTVTYSFAGDTVPVNVTAPESAVYEEGTTVKVADAPEAEGYIFNGWTTEDIELDGDEFVINSNVHFVGEWEKLYKVEYKYAEGYPVPDDAPTAEMLGMLASVQKAGNDVDVAGMITANGYIFVGWSTDDADGVGDMFTMPENDVVFYGYFKKPVESVEFIGGDVTVNINEETKLNVYVKPEDATVKDLVYESSDEAVVTVDKYGNIKPVGEGTATVTVSSKDDPTKKDTITVTVKVPVTDITVDKTEINLNKGDNDKITADVNDGATNKEVTYESSDETVVKVDENGNIEAVGEGEAVITVSSKDNPEIKEEIKATVKVPVTGITATEDFTIGVNESGNLEAQVNEDATYKGLVYESSDPDVVKVDNEGNVVAVGEGTAVITIISKDNPEVRETVTVTVKNPVEDVIIPEESLELEIGEKDTIDVTVTPEDATNKEVTYESSDETVVKVDENGNIEAVGEGTATITVTSKDDPTKKDTITVTVKKPVVDVEDVIIPEESLELEIGEKDTIDVTVTPESATNKEVTYESSDEAVVKVDENGVIEAVGEGTATITVTSKDDQTKKDTITVTVKKPVVDVEDVIIPEESLELEIGEKDTIDVTVTPEDATNKEVTYESSDEAVVKVDENGNIEAVGEGTATITVTSKDDPTKKDTITITVKKPVVGVEDVIIPEESLELEIGEKDTIDVTVTPESATNKEVTYESSDEAVVKVDENGNIEAVGEGTATITVTSKDDPTKKDTIIITVKKPVVDVEDVIIPKDEIHLLVGDKNKVPVTVTPESATNKEVTYESSDEAVVKVDENGNIEAVGEGTATITVTSKDDPTKKDTITVTVKKPLPQEPSYTITVPESLSLVIGDKKPVGVVITPDDGKINPVYKSADESIVKVDANGNVTATGVGSTTISVDFGGGDIRIIPVTVIAVPEGSIPVKHHIAFGKTDGIGWYEVSVNGGDFFPQGPNSTLEVDEGSILVVRVQDMWIDDDFTFYVNGKKVKPDAANTITVVVDGYMLIGALSMDVEVPDVDESLSLFEKILNAIRDFFRWLFRLD